MEKRINYIQLILVLVCTFAGVFGGIWAAWELFMQAEMQNKVDIKFEQKQYVTQPQLDVAVSKAVLNERQDQAEKKTGSLSYNITRELEAEGLPIPREQVAPAVAKMVVWGFKRMEEYENQADKRLDFEKTRYICPVVIEGKWYFRHEDGDYPISTKMFDNGYYTKFWRYPKDDDKRILPSISRIKDQ